MDGWGFNTKGGGLGNGSGTKLTEKTYKINNLITRDQRPEILSTPPGYCKS